MTNRNHEADPVIFGAFVLATLLALAVPAARAAETTAPSAAASPQKNASRLRIDAGKAKEWDNISKALPEVTFDNFPLSEVTRILRDQFKNEFDVLVPSVGYPTAGTVDPATGLPVDPSLAESPGAVGVNLRLNNVTVSQIFHAMNLSFEINRQPLHWDLTVNGSRPTAVLRFLELPPPIVPAAPSLPSEPQKRAVFYVGDLLGSPEAGGLEFRQIHQTLLAVCAEAFHREPRISIHEAAQLLVVTGTSDELDLVRETLTALKEKLKPSAERKGQSKAPESKGKLAEPKTP